MNIVVINGKSIPADKITSWEVIADTLYIGFGYQGDFAKKVFKSAKIAQSMAINVLDAVRGNFNHIVFDLDQLSTL